MLKRKEARECVFCHDYALSSGTGACDNRPESDRRYLSAELQHKATDKILLSQSTRQKLKHNRSLDVL